MQMMQEPFTGFNSCQPMSTQSQVHVPQLQPTVGLDKEMTNLDKALHDLEFEAQHSMKLVNQRKQRLELLQQKHVSGRMEMARRKTKASEFDDQCKQLHRQFIRYNELTKSFLSSNTPSVDHQLRIQKEIEAMGNEYDTFKNQKEKLLDQYRSILKERRSFCATMPGMEKLTAAKHDHAGKQTEVIDIKREKSNLQIQKEELEARVNTLPGFLRSGGAFVVRLAQLKLSSLNLLKEAGEIDQKIVEKKEELIRKTSEMAPALEECVEARASNGLEISEVRHANPPNRSACLPTLSDSDSDATSHYFSKKSALGNSSQVPVLTLNMGPAPRPPPPSKSRQSFIPCPVPFKQPKLSLDFGLEMQIPSLRVPTKPDPPRTPRVALPPTRVAPLTPVPDFTLRPVPCSPLPRLTIGAGPAQSPGAQAPAIRAISPDTPRPPVIQSPKVARPTSAPKASAQRTHDLQSVATSLPTPSFKKTTSSLLNDDSSASTSGHPPHVHNEPQFKVPLPPESRPTSLYAEPDFCRQATNFADRESRYAESPPDSNDAGSPSTSFHFSPTGSGFSSAFGSGEPDSFSFGSSNKDQGFGMFGTEDGNEDFGFSFGSGTKSPPSEGFGFFGGGDTDANGPMSFF